MMLIQAADRRQMNCLNGLVLLPTGTALNYDLRDNPRLKQG